GGSPAGIHGLFSGWYYGLAGRKVTLRVSMAWAKGVTTGTLVRYETYTFTFIINHEDCSPDVLLMQNFGEASGIPFSSVYVRDDEDGVFLGENRHVAPYVYTLLNASGIIITKEFGSGEGDDDNLPFTMRSSSTPLESQEKSFFLSGLSDDMGTERVPSSSAESNGVICSIWRIPSIASNIRSVRMDGVRVQDELKEYNGPRHEIETQNKCVPYTSRAHLTISRHFQCLRDVINGQIHVARQSLGEQGDSSDRVLPRLRKMQKQLRQQRSLQHLGVSRHSWRLQRGLPEALVSILRA
ncbi:hypothetical protein Tco_0256478, partial [Tanacetum coccineum]